MNRCLCFLAVAALAAGLRADDKPAAGKPAAKPVKYYLFADLEGAVVRVGDAALTVRVEWVEPAQVAQFQRVAPTFSLASGRRNGSVGATTTRRTPSKQRHEDYEFGLAPSALVRWELPPHKLDAKGKPADLSPKEAVAFRSEWLRVPGFAARPDDLTDGLPINVRLVLPVGVAVEAAKLEDVRVERVVIPGRQKPLPSEVIAGTIEYLAKLKAKK